MKITFRGAHIRYFDGRFDEEAGQFCRIHVTADLSKPVMEEMAWAPSEGITQGKLIGDLAASHFVLTPNSKELRKNELQLACNQAHHFEFSRVKDGESFRNELHFVIISRAIGAAAHVEQYLRVIGAAQGQLKLQYDEQAVQPAQPDEQQELLTTAEQRAAVSPAQDNVEEQADGAEA